jgi:hypothetical protein
VPTLRSAAALLAAATDIASLAPIAAIVGCTGHPGTLDTHARAALGVPTDCEIAAVARGPDTLRAILLEVRGDRPIRDVMSLLARRLSSRAPHMLWLAVAGRPSTEEVAIAAWAPTRAGVRVSALLVDRTRIADSDAETLCALSAGLESVDVLTHARWVAVLGREAVTRRFYRALERLVEALADGARGRASMPVRRDVALLYASRLLFLSFLEAKEWLDGDRSFLGRRYDDCMGARGGYQRRVLVPLFFGTLNTPVTRRAPLARSLGRIPFLNGGLFSRSAVESAHADIEFRDEELGRFLLELLGRYRFTAREESSEWSEAAIDPEMLGRAFESLMAGHERRSTGAFFTPHELVTRVTDEALEHALGVSLHELLRPDAAPVAGMSASFAESTRARLGRIRLLDPACGSGAFLVHALERIAGALQALGDSRPIAELRRATLMSSIFGVDINPTAVWLCQLRLWLSVVIESSVRDPSHVAPLPNLDRHVRIGDALAGNSAGAFRSRETNTIARLRARYARAVGVRKRTLAHALDRAERAAAIAALDARIDSITSTRREIIVATRERDLFGERPPISAATRASLLELKATLRLCRTRRRSLAAGGALPFSFATHFADVAASGGFDVVIGNPPWVRVHRIPTAARAALRREYASYRAAAWRDGAAAARAGVGFAGQVDLAALFVERSLGVVAEGGIVALLVPAKLWRSLAGGGIRRLLASEHQLLGIEDWSDAPALFDAAVYPSAIFVRRLAAPSETTADVRVTVHASRVAVTWGVYTRELWLDDTSGAPWLLLPPPARRSFDALRGAGVSLGASIFGPPMLGVKCGCNGAFVLTGDPDSGIPTSNGTPVHVEHRLLRPLVRGEHVTPWQIVPSGEHVIWTHGPDGAALDRLPPQAERWFRGWRRRLMARADARSTTRWWSLFRTEAAAGTGARVIWSDFGRSVRAAVLLPGDATVPLNTCYATRCPSVPDALALAVILNSPLASAWLAVLAEPARGGYRRYLGWTLSLFPLPAAWERARATLAPIGEQAMSGSAPSNSELLEIVTRAYGLRHTTVNALLDWSIR